MENKIKLKTKFLINAVNNSLPIKRSPAGGKSKISTETTLTPASDNQLLVETPLRSTLIEIEGIWKEKIDVDAITLEKIIKAFVEDEYLQMWISEKYLIVKGKAQYNLPIK